MLFSNNHAKSKALLFKKHANKNKTNAIQRGRNNSNISIASTIKLTIPGANGTNNFPCV